jgi:cyclophilin family peptidyl-prolyl cis-trans isomerase
MSRRVLLLLAFCLALLAGCEQPRERLQAQRTIARWEDRRYGPADSLAAMITHPDAHVRLAAVRAAGLIGRDDVLPELRAALADPSGTVAAQAAFSLGLLGNPRAAEDLVASVRHGSPSLRLAALEGLAHLDQGAEALLEAALHADEAEAARAWDGLRDRAEQVAPARLAEAVRAGLARPEAAVLWRVLRCAEKLPDSSLVDAIAPFARDPRPLVRGHACRALGRQRTPRALAAVLRGWQEPVHAPDWQQAQVRVAQLRAIGELAGRLLGTGSAAPPSLPAAGQAAAADVVAVLRAGVGDGDPRVVATALEAMARAVTDLPLAAGADLRESLLPVWRIRLLRLARERLDNPHACVRIAAATACGRLRGAGVSPLLEPLLADSLGQVRAAALAEIIRCRSDPWPLLWGYAEPAPGVPILLRTTALAAGSDRVLDGSPGDQAAPPLPSSEPARHLARLLTEAVVDSDFVVAATAAPLLGRLPQAASLAALCAAWNRDRAEGRSDVRLAVLAGVDRFFAAVDSLPPQVRDTAADQVAPMLESAFDDPDVRVRRRGREVATLHRLLDPAAIPSLASLEATVPPHERSPLQPPLQLPFAAPRVRCTTPRGDFVIEVDGQVAPNTAAAFLHLVREGFYDGLTFHRVVPGFVVQGGDPRGDGWGGPGFTLRSEWSRTPYVRGTVGIAHDGKDTGGSQFFIALSPQPHLNGRYTVFGRVVEGMEVLDAIEPQDPFHLAVEP